MGLSDWLQSWGVTHVAMESTGEYGKPVFNILEGNCAVLLVNAQHVQAGPGRKTDVSEAEWLADLLRRGLLRASVIPPMAQRDLRDLTRFRRTFVRARATVVNRVPKVLEDANSKLASVASDGMGVSGRAMLAALLDGHTTAETMADWAQGRLREKRPQLVQALAGRVKPPHRFVLGELGCPIDHRDETMARFDEQIQKACAPFEEAVVHLATIPGVARATAETIVAEIGTEMGRFPSAADWASWAGVAPGNHASAGKRLSGKMRKGNQSLRVALNQAAPAAARTQETSLSAP